MIMPLEYYTFFSKLLIELDLVNGSTSCADQYLLKLLAKFYICIGELLLLLFAELLRT